MLIICCRYKSNASTPFLRIPLEIRLHIYSLVCAGTFLSLAIDGPRTREYFAKTKTFKIHYEKTGAIDLRFLRTCCQVFGEARKVPYRVNRFLFEGGSEGWSAAEDLALFVFPDSHRYIGHLAIKIVLRSCEDEHKWRPLLRQVLSRLKELRNLSILLGIEHRHASYEKHAPMHNHFDGTILWAPTPSIFKGVAAHHPCLRKKRIRIQIDNISWVVFTQLDREEVSWIYTGSDTIRLALRWLDDHGMTPQRETTFEEGRLWVKNVISR